MGNPMELPRQEFSPRTKEEVQADIKALEDRRESITAWGDTDPRDYDILDQIDRDLKALQEELSQAI